MRVECIMGMITCVCLAVVPPTFAQASGNIIGSVIDASGGRIAGVTVTVVNNQTSVERKVATNESGSYVVTALLPAEYDVTVEIQGFRRALKHATVNVGRDV